MLPEHYQKPGLAAIQILPGQPPGPEKGLVDEELSFLSIYLKNL
jgi:hypothetical protein